MNLSPFFQTAGNVCVGLAAALYALPLQLLLWELSRKRDNGAGLILGILILVPMWLLLMAGLICVTANGGFDWLPFTRRWITTFVVPATLALAVFSIARLDLGPLIRSQPFTRTLVASLIQLLPALTILLVVRGLNPRLAPGIPLKAVSVPWTFCAALSLATVGGYIGYQVAAAGANHVRAIAHRFHGDSELAKKNLALIPALDPQRDFTQLLGFTGDFQSQALREAAAAQLRRHPDFVARLATELKDGSVSGGSVDHALAAVAFAALTSEEKQILALPARTAMQHITRYIRSNFRHFTQDRRTLTQKWGTRVFQAVATKLNGAGVDFRPTLAGFEKAFTAPGEEDD